VSEAWQKALLEKLRTKLNSIFYLFGVSMSSTGLSDVEFEAGAFTCDGWQSVLPYVGYEIGLEKAELTSLFASSDCNVFSVLAIILAVKHNPSIYRT